MRTNLTTKYSYKAALIVAAISWLMFSSIAFAQTSVAVAVKFDEFGDIQASALIARLDNLAIQLQNQPDAKGFLVVYRTSRDLPGLSNRYAHRMEGYLVKSRGISADRIVTVDGGEASCLIQELWIVPPGTTPKPRDDAYARSYHPSVYKFDEHYIGEKGDLYYWRDAPNDLLEGFALELQRNPKTIGYLIRYTNARRGPRAARSHSHYAQNFLISHYGIKPNRIRTIEGGYRERPTVELWISEGKGAVPIITSYRYSPRQKPAR